MFVDERSCRMPRNFDSGIEHEQEHEFTQLYADIPRPRLTYSRCHVIELDVFRISPAVLSWMFAMSFTLQKV